MKKLLRIRTALPIFYIAITLLFFGITSCSPHYGCYYGSVRQIHSIDAVKQPDLAESCKG
jgi:hypothetical protein